MQSAWSILLWPTSGPASRALFHLTTTVNKHIIGSYSIYGSILKPLIGFAPPVHQCPPHLTVPGDMSILLTVITLWIPYCVERRLPLSCSFCWGRRVDSLRDLGWGWQVVRSRWFRVLCKRWWTPFSAELMTIGSVLPVPVLSLVIPARRSSSKLVFPVIYLAFQVPEMVIS